MNRPLAVAVPLLAVLALAGCVAPSGGTVDPSSAPSAPSGSPTVTSTNPANPSPPVDDATVEPVPEAGGDSQAAAIAAAEKAVTAFARPDLPYQQWIDGLYPYLSQTGAAAYEDTDPTRIPVHQLTGAGKILPASTELALIVQVPTDAGPYNVSLSRPKADSAWLADRIRPAEG